MIVNYNRRNNEVLRNTDFWGIPGKGGATCKTRAKIKRLAQNFGLLDLNDNRLKFLFNHTNFIKDYK